MTTTISKHCKSVRDWFVRKAGAGLVKYWLDLTPVPAARPRVTKRGTYYPKKYEEFRKVSKSIVDAWPDNIPHEGPISVLVETIIAKPKKPSKDYPSRSDVDNYAKGPLDALVKSGKVWGDDRQIVSLFITKRYAEEGDVEGFLVHWFPVEE